MGCKAEKLIEKLRAKHENARKLANKEAYSSAISQLEELIKSRKSQKIEDEVLVRTVVARVNLPEDMDDITEEEAEALARSLDSSDYYDNYAADYDEAEYQIESTYPIHNAVLMEEIKQKLAAMFPEIEVNAVDSLFSTDGVEVVGKAVGG